MAELNQHRTKLITQIASELFFIRFYYTYIVFPLSWEEMYHCNTEQSSPCRSYDKGGYEYPTRHAEAICPDPHEEENYHEHNQSYRTKWSWKKMFFFFFVFVFYHLDFTAC